MHNNSGHLGIEKIQIKSKLRARLYWPGWQRTMKQWCKTCSKCCLQSERPFPQITYCMTSSVTGCQFERYAVDLMGPFSTTEPGNKYIMAIDYFSRWSESYALPNQEAWTVSKKLVQEFVLRLGVLHIVHSDQRRTFKSNLWGNVQLLQIDKQEPLPIIINQRFKWRGQKKSLSACYQLLWKIIKATEVKFSHM